MPFAVTRGALDSALISAHSKRLLPTAFRALQWAIAENANGLLAPIGRRSDMREWTGADMPTPGRPETTQGWPENAALDHGAHADDQACAQRHELWAPREAGAQPGVPTPIGDDDKASLTTTGGTAWSTPLGCA
jgi:hypothetical protein